MDKYPIVVKLTVCSEFTNWQSQTEYKLIYADSLTDAAKIIDDYAGNEIVQCEFTFVDEAFTLITLPKEFAEQLIKNGMPRM